MTDTTIHYIMIYMVKIIESIPNFSEGRNADVIESLAIAAKSVPGATLLDYSADADHNRSVFTLLGAPGDVAEAVFRMCAIARDKIDMSKHSGVHPRIGAADVIPFVPVKGCEMSECVDISRQVASRIASELSIPCFLYEESCTCEIRRNLANIRKGGFEGMARKLMQAEWAPDFGERAIHPTAGATAVGARRPLVAFNINLDTADLSVAKKIAKTIRESDGGIKYCKAIGVELNGRGATQVSMNLTNCDATPMYVVFEAVRAEAGKYGAAIMSSEIIGLVQAKNLVACAAHYLKLESFACDKQILDNYVNEQRNSRFI